MGTLSDESHLTVNIHPIHLRYSQLSTERIFVSQRIERNLSLWRRSLRLLILFFIALVVLVAVQPWKQEWLDRKIAIVLRAIALAVVVICAIFVRGRYVLSWTLEPIFVLIAVSAEVLFAVFMAVSYSRSGTLQTLNLLSMCFFVLGYVLSFRTMWTVVCPSLVGFELTFLAGFIWAEMDERGRDLLVQTENVVAVRHVLLFSLLIGLLIYACYEAELKERRDFLTDLRLSINHGKLFQQQRRLAASFNRSIPRSESHRIKTKIDLAAPVQKVSRMLQDLETTEGVGPREVNELKLIQRLLSDNRDIFAPNIKAKLATEDGQKTVDDEVKQYLMLFSSAANNENAAAKRRLSKRGSILVDPLPGIQPKLGLSPLSRGGDSGEHGGGGGGAGGGHISHLPPLTMASVRTSSSQHSTTHGGIVSRGGAGGGAGGAFDGPPISSITTQGGGLAPVNNNSTSLRRSSLSVFDIQQYLRESSESQLSSDSDAELVREREAMNQAGNVHRKGSSRRGSTMVSEADNMSVTSNTGASGIVPEAELEEIESSAVTLDALSWAVETLDQWDFDVFRLHRETSGTPIFYLAQLMGRELGFFTRLKVDQKLFASFMYRIDNAYLSNIPYHTNIHGADVGQAMYYFIKRAGLQNILMDIEMLACIVGAVIHDVGHNGLNNDFHVNTQSELAVAFNDRSVLEHYHLARAFGVLKDDSCNFFSTFSPQERVALRKLIVDIVLATDMGQHFDILSQIRSVVQNRELNTADFADRLILMKMSMKTADISNPCKNWEIHYLWTAKYIEETFNQGDKERVLNLPISPFMDRHNPNIAKCEVGFFDFIIIPLWNLYKETMRKAVRARNAAARASPLLDANGSAVVVPGADIVEEEREMMDHRFNGLVDAIKHMEKNHAEWKRQLAEELAEKERAAAAKA